MFPLVLRCSPGGLTLSMKGAERQEKSRVCDFKGRLKNGKETAQNRLFRAVLYLKSYAIFVSFSICRPQVCMGRLLPDLDILLDPWIALSVLRPASVGADARLFRPDA